MTAHKSLPPTRPRPIRHIGPHTLPRRSFLRGSVAGLGVSVGLPVLDIMLNDHGDALAAGDELPTRFGVFYWGGGITHKYWVPTQTGADWQPPLILEPLAPLKPYVTLVTGTSHADSSPGHIPARGIALSSSHDLTRCTGDCVGVFRGQNMPEPSLDALVAEAWQGRTKFKSVEIGICRKGPYKSNSSWQRGGKVYNRHEPSPQRLFERLFAAGVPSSSAPPPVVQATTAYEKSMLDAVMADTRALSQKLGGDDRARLDAHLDGLRALEMQLQARERMPMPAAGNNCVMPEPVPTRNFGDDSSREEKEAKSRIMSELLATALACDLTRVFSYEWSATQSTAIYWEVGNNEEHHEWNHRASASLEYAKSIQFIMKNLAYLADQLKGKREGAGTLLDRTLIFATSEHANAGGHNYDDHPLLLVGKAGGRLRAGVHARVAKGDNQAPRVMLTAVRAVGVELPKLGQAEGESGRVATTTLSEIEV